MWTASKMKGAEETFLQTNKPRLTVALSACSFSLARNSDTFFLPPTEKKNPDRFIFPLQTTFMSFPTLLSLSSRGKAG